jgi:hypothetical protein
MSAYPGGCKTSYKAIFGKHIGRSSISVAFSNISIVPHIEHAIHTH